MKEKKQNEELQSRREFFKQAAKKALPVIGAIALASSPIIAQAATKEPMSCDYNCGTACSGRCTGSCTSQCMNDCNTACKYSCQGSCKGNCENGCQTSCRGLNYR